MVPFYDIYFCLFLILFIYCFLDFIELSVFFCSSLSSLKTAVLNSLLGKLELKTLGSVIGGIVIFW